MTSFCKYSVDLGIAEGKVWELEEPSISRDHMVIRDTQGRHAKTDKIRDVNWPEVIRQIPSGTTRQAFSYCQLFLSLGSNPWDCKPSQRLSSRWAKWIPDAASGVFRKLIVEFLQVAFVNTPDMWVHWRNKPPAWDPNEYCCWFEALVSLKLVFDI